MTTACALGVVGVDRAAVDGGNGVLHIAALIERVGVDCHLHIVALRNIQRRTYGGWRSAPILVNLQTASAGCDLLLDGLCCGAVAFAQ